MKSWISHGVQVCTSRPFGSLLMVVAIAAMTLAVNARAVQITDDRGRVITLAAPPQRIVSLLPSLTETVCALQQCHRLVGVDRYASWPAEVRALPRLGGGLDPDIEGIVALRPEVVLVDGSSRSSERLTALGLTVVAFNTQTHADVQRIMQRLGQLLGLPPARAHALWQRVEQDLLAVARDVPVDARGARVYVEISRAPYAAGEASFIGETLSRMGLRNIVPATLGPFPRLNPESIVQADPDLILVTERGFDGIEQRPGWQHIRAVRQRRICRFSAMQADTIVRPGPRLAEGARAVAACLSAAYGKTKAAR